MSKTLQYRSMSIKAVPTYTCDQCGAQAQGAVVTQTFTERAWSRPQDVATSIEHAAGQVSNNHMPENWAGYGITRHLCPSCKR